MKQVSILMPTVRSDGRGQRCMDGLLMSLSHFRPDEVEVIAVVEGAGAERIDYANELRLSIGAKGSVIWRKTVRGAVYGWNEAARRSSGDMLVLAADDLVFQTGWLDELLKVRDQTHTLEYVIGLNTEEEETLFTHYGMSRDYAMQQLGGVFIPPMYRSYYFDVEINDRARESGQLFYAKDSKVTHNHYSKGFGIDQVYSRARSAEWIDNCLFQWRSKSLWPQNYPPQLIDGNRRSVFWTILKPVASILQRRIFDLIKYLADLPGNTDYYYIDVDQGRTDVTRNQIVDQFLRMSTDESDTLVMLDGDHDHPLDIVPRLAQSSVPVTAAWTTTRGPVGPAMFLRDEGNNLVRIEDWPDNELIRVAALGMGAVAFKRSVFDALEKNGAHFPYFRYAYCDGSLDMPSEDIYFSAACEQSGVGMAVDTSIYSDHIVTALL